MNNMIRSTWLRCILLFALVLSASNCGDETEIIIEELECPALEGFAGGVYFFTVDVDGIIDKCAGGTFNAFIDPGPYGPVTLPPSSILPQEITLELPLVGVVTATLSLNGGVMRLEVDPIQVSVPIFGTVDVTAGVSGTLCPISATRVDAGFAIEVIDVDPPLIGTPCTVIVPSTFQSE